MWNDTKIYLRPGCKMAGGGIMAPPGAGAVPVVDDWKGFVCIFPALKAAAVYHIKFVTILLKSSIHEHKCLQD